MQMSQPMHVNVFQCFSETFAETRGTEGQPRPATTTAAADSVGTTSAQATGVATGHHSTVVAQLAASVQPDGQATVAVCNPPAAAATTTRPYQQAAAAAAVQSTSHEAADSCAAESVAIGDVSAQPDPAGDKDSHGARSDPS